MRKTIVGQFFKIVFNIYAAGLIIYFFFRIFWGYRFWPVAFVSQLIHLILIFSFPILLLLLVLKSWKRAAITLSAVFAFIWLFGDLFMPKTFIQQQCNEGDKLIRMRVMTFNTGAGLADPESLLDYIKASKAMIIGLQEISGDQAALIDFKLKEDYPYQSLYGLGSRGLGILSKFPILESKLVDVNKEFLPPYLFARLEVFTKDLCVIIFRAHPPRLGWYVSKFGYHTWLSAHILGPIAISNAPAIILGDFNMTDQSEDYVSLNHMGLKDAYRQAGYGFGLTFPAKSNRYPILPDFPLFRIDYIWTTRELNTCLAWVGDDVGSDHLPVFAELVWGRE